MIFAGGCFQLTSGTVGHKGKSGPLATPSSVHLGPCRSKPAPGIVLWKLLEASVVYGAMELRVPGDQLLSESRLPCFVPAAASRYSLMAAQHRAHCRSLALWLRKHG